MVSELFGWFSGTFLSFLLICRIRTCYRMSDFFEKLIASLAKHSERGGGVGLSDCMIWFGCTDHNGYGIKRVKWPSGATRLEKAHRLAYMADRKIYCLPKLDESGLQLDISHLCHTKNCIEPSHLTLESHTLNLSRSYCKSSGACSFEHSPPCVF